MGYLELKKHECESVIPLIMQTQGIKCYLLLALSLFASQFRLHVCRLYLSCRFPGLFVVVFLIPNKIIFSAGRNSMTLDSDMSRGSKPSSLNGRRKVGTDCCHKCCFHASICVENYVIYKLIYSTDMFICINVTCLFTTQH